jgi:hypothetical protein
MRLFGNPIDCLWSMLTRHEVNRRLYGRANSLLSGRDDLKKPLIDAYLKTPLVEAIAGIWMAYDEIGWS